MPDPARGQTPNSSGGTIALLAVMLLSGAIGWWLQLIPHGQVDATSLAELPREIGFWRSRDIPLASEVESVLRADYNLQRVYWGPTGDPVWLYVGYYGTERGGRPEHTPRGCYTGAGWGILGTRVVDIAPSQGLRANEYSIEKNGDSRLVHFWYRTNRSTGILGGLDQNIDRLLGRLLDGRADGALIRLSTPVTKDDVVGARGRLLSLASLLDPLVGEHWPTEKQCGPGSVGEPACAPADPVEPTTSGSASSRRTQRPRSAPGALARSELLREQLGR